MQLDRIYLEAPRKIAILDHEKNQTFVVMKDGLPDAGNILIPICSLICIVSYLLQQSQKQLKKMTCTLAE
jgi:hypothetical protein